LAFSDENRWMSMSVLLSSVMVTVSEPGWAKLTL
jgi:hypothetical protein